MATTIKNFCAWGSSRLLPSRSTTFRKAWQHSLRRFRTPIWGLRLPWRSRFNIPEGISVSVPIFYATGNRKKAFTYSILSGLSEPVGAGVAYLGLRFFVGGESGAIPSQVMGVLFAGVAGIMVYISLDELLPTSRAYAKGHDSLLGLMAGMIVMALSLLLMK